MLIEFCCPVCCAPLAVKEEVAGGQVNCPKCQKLILIPGESPVKRTNGHAPFEDVSSFSGPEVAKAISISVDPYRRELETKAGLLNDAVEMVKTRNKRIREIESLILKTQKELWELEVEHDERNEDYIRAQTERKQLKLKLRDLGTTDDKPAIAAAEEMESLKDKLQKADTRAETMKKKLEASLESLAAANQRTSQLFEQIRSLPVTPDFMEKMHDQVTLAQEQIEEAHPELDQAVKHLQNARAKLEAAAEFIGTLKKERDELLAKVEQIEQQLQQKEESLAKAREQQAQVKEQDKEQDVLLVEISTERDYLESELKSTREQGTLWEEEAKELRAKVAASETKAHKKEAALEKKIARLQAEFDEQAERLRDVLKNQQVLADQSVKLEEQRAELKRKLSAAEDRIEELEEKTS